jgi:hypothetical protein
MVPVALALPLLALEIALRLFGPILPGNYRTGFFVAAHSIYGRFHVPGFDGWVKNPEYAAHVKISSIGLRDDEVAIPKPPGTFRIVLLGDSFVEGAQVSVGQPSSEVLERALNALPTGAGRPTRYEVVNAGVGGWGPGEEYLWLKTEGLGLQPDVVIQQLYLGNDISDAGCRLSGQDELKQRVCFYLDASGQLYEDELRPRPPRPADFWRDGPRQYSVLFNVFESGVLETQEGRVTDEPAANWRSHMRVFSLNVPRGDRPLWEEAWQVTGALVGESKRATEGASATYILTSVPTIYQVYPDEWGQAVAENNLKPDQWDLDRPGQRLGEIASRLGATYLDMAPAFREAAQSSRSQLYYHYDLHITAAGHEVVARILERLLAERGLVS